MRIHKTLLERIILEAILQEVDIEDVSDICYTAGSTHVMKTCKIGKDDFFLKFSDEDFFDDFDPSLQILIEYLAYRIYGLYSGVKIPRVELVYDKSEQKVGIATSPAKGTQRAATGLSQSNPQFLAKMLSQGVYVDVFLANWDVIGTGTGNLFVDPDDEEATRIDPGGSLTFRAQGGRKGRAFGKSAGELETMLSPGTGAGRVFSLADLRVASKEFLSVPWPQIALTIKNVEKEVSSELQSKGMSALLSQWKADVSEIESALKERHKEVAAHAKVALKGM